MIYNQGDRVIHVQYPHYVVGTVMRADHKSLMVVWDYVKPPHNCHTYMQGSKSLSLVEQTHSQPNIESAKSTGVTPMNLNGQQKELLLIMREGMRRELYPRSNVLAAAMATSTSTMSKVGLELRDKGLVASHNDGQSYNYWTLTCTGQALAAELANGKATKTERYVVYSFCAGLSYISQEYKTQGEAEVQAKLMANQHVGRVYKVAKTDKGFTVEQTFEERTIVERKAVNKLVEL